MKLDQETTTPVQDIPAALDVFNNIDGQPNRSEFVDRSNVTIELHENVNDPALEGITNTNEVARNPSEVIDYSNNLVEDEIAKSEVFLNDLNINEEERNRFVEITSAYRGSLQASTEDLKYNLNAKDSVAEPEKYIPDEVIEAEWTPSVEAKKPEANVEEIKSEQSKAEASPEGPKTYAEMKMEAHYAATLVPENKGLFQGMADKVKSYFLKKLLATPAAFVRGVQENISNKVVKTIDNVRRFTPGTRTSILLNSVLVSEAEEGWLSEKGSLKDLKKQYEGHLDQVTVLTKTYNEGLAQRDLFKGDKNNPDIVERINNVLTRIKGDIEAHKDASLKVKDEYNAKYKEMAKARERRDKYVEKLEQKIAENLAPLDKKTETIKSALQGYDKVISVYTDLATEMGAKIESIKKSSQNPEFVKRFGFIVDGAQGLESRRQKALSLAQEHSDERQSARDRLNNIAERAKPWIEMKKQLEERKQTMSRYTLSVIE